jgi:hypothetical protein
LRKSQIFQDDVLTRDKTKKTNWLGSLFVSSDRVESSCHLLFTCSIVKYL